MPPGSQTMLMSFDRASRWRISAKVTGCPGPPSTAARARRAACCQRQTPMPAHLPQAARRPPWRPRQPPWQQAPSLPPGGLFTPCGRPYGSCRRCCWSACGNNSARPRTPSPRRTSMRPCCARSRPPPRHRPPRAPWRPSSRRSCGWWATAAAKTANRRLSGGSAQGW